MRRCEKERRRGRENVTKGKDTKAEGKQRESAGVPGVVRSHVLG